MRRGFGRKSGKQKYGGDKGHGVWHGMGTRMWAHFLKTLFPNKKSKIKPIASKLKRLKWNHK